MVCPFGSFSKKGVIEIVGILGRSHRDQEERIAGNPAIVVGDQGLNDRLVDIHGISKLADHLPGGKVNHAGGPIIGFIHKIEFVLAVDLSRREVELLVRSHEEATESGTCQRVQGRLGKQALRGKADI